MKRYLYDESREHSSCGVGFITNKSSKQTHELLVHAHQALCMIPHRGGMSAEGIGDGAGVNIDLSVDFFRQLTGQPDLELGRFGVANFFFPEDIAQHKRAEALIQAVFDQHQFDTILWRDMPVNNDVLNPASQVAQLNIKQIVFACPAEIRCQTEFESVIYRASLEIEAPAYTDETLYGLYPLSMSSRTQVLKGRLNSWEVMPYFVDLMNEDHKVHTLFFHTRFSTNTAPNPMFSQPFQRMAHNGELNTDRKNRLSEDAIARFKQKQIIFPKGQSDSARLDQTLARRVCEDQLAIDLAALAMMPPAWENQADIPSDVREMLEYYSLYEEKNDGPAAFIFGDGVKIGARLDRLGLRPLRTVETDEYLAVMSEAGQINFPAESVIKRGRVEAGGMIVFDHGTGKVSYTQDIMTFWAKKQNYKALLAAARITLSSLPAVSLETLEHTPSLPIAARHVGYSMNQESFKFMLDPMIQTGKEKISAMGYGVAPNALARDEGGLSRYFSQRFAQVTNPPLDSIREADGMTLRVALGAKPNMTSEASGLKNGQQLVLSSPVLQPQQLQQIRQQAMVSTETVAMVYQPDLNDGANNQQRLLTAIESVTEATLSAVSNGKEIIILSDEMIAEEWAAIPALLVVPAINQRLIQQGLRFHVSLICETGQAASTHDIACLLGFGASAIMPLTVYDRIQTLYDGITEREQALNRFQQAAEKALMKTMGKFGLCTVESYIGGEFFEANFIDTQDSVLATIFPNIHSPVGGAGFADIADNVAFWHQKVFEVFNDVQIPVLGLFKERAEGAGHSFGNTAVREYINMTSEPIQYIEQGEGSATNSDDGYHQMGYSARTPAQIDSFQMTAAYRQFSQQVYAERQLRPAALRDVLSLPLAMQQCHRAEQFVALFEQVSLLGSPHFSIQGMRVNLLTDNQYRLVLESGTAKRHHALYEAIKQCYPQQVTLLGATYVNLVIAVEDDALSWIKKLICAPAAIRLSQVQPAHEITATFASGAMSHGALVEKAHEAVAQGTNIAGAMSNSGEGGEGSHRYNTVKASKIKQFASGRFGVWTGYLADPALQEIEIKIAQGAKPGEGGQLPSAKVTVEIAAARGGTPGVELVSPPPHHDTYSIEDLGQLIHDAKAARVRVIVKLVSSEGVGTIAVGVAKAGADVINIAGNTGGTGAAQVTSLKNTGRQASIGIAEVHQALSANGLRDKVILRCSDAHQTGQDVIKSAILGADSFEFGTTALMMLKCVMAKNCNLKCPAGLTTNPEVYQGDPRALAQYFMNLGHEVRELLAGLGIGSLRELRGRTDLMHLMAHPAMVGQLDMSAMLKQAKTVTVAKPIYLEADFTPDNAWLSELKSAMIAKKQSQYQSSVTQLSNRNKTVGGQLAIDIERILNYEFSQEQAIQHPAVMILANGRRVLVDDSVMIHTYDSAGQSYGAFNNSGMTLHHQGTCNDGVGKGASGGRIIVSNAGGGGIGLADNVLVGNFALFGATGGELYIEGQAGDRFGVRNSGAVAVVEGVGDFCCEYMTNGSIINLGSYGKGFGNGMSGGVAFQYDPTADIINACSQDSVRVVSLADEGDLVEGLKQALLIQLSHHIDATGSLLAESIVDDWEVAQRAFYAMIPQAMFSYHCADQIALTNDRKMMLEELAQDYAKRHMMRIKKAYQQAEQQDYLFDGKLPEYGERDSDLICGYINASGVIRRGYELAEKSAATKLGEPIGKVTRHLFDSEDRKLVEVLIKDCKAVLASYENEGLQALLATKRLQDYKDALSAREVCDTRAYATSVWVMIREQENRAELAQRSSFKQQLAAHYCHVLTAAIKSAA